MKTNKWVYITWSLACCWKARIVTHWRLWSLTIYIALGYNLLSTQKAKAIRLRSSYWPTGLRLHLLRRRAKLPKPAYAFPWDQTPTQPQPLTHSLLLWLLPSLFLTREGLSSLNCSLGALMNLPQLLTCYFQCDHHSHILRDKPF